MSKVRASRGVAKLGGDKALTRGLPFRKTGSASPLRFPIVAIGASAGGLEAISQLVEHLTPDLGMAYVVVEHLDPSHKSMLVELLSRQTNVPVEEVRNKTKVVPDRIYIIPPNRNMYIKEGELRLTSRAAGPARHMPIDFFFRSVSHDCPGNCIAIVLSGTGSDGALGIDEIKSTGGITFAQDQNSAKHDGMPRAAIATGQIDYVLAPEVIALELRRIANHPYTHGRQIAELSEEAQLQRIFAMLRTRTSVDFKHYKQNTIKRRIFRRMALLKIEKVGAYIRVLTENQKELDALYHDLLIKVTSFFREPASFKVLQDKVFAAIVKSRIPQEPIRIWVPGCSSGEEVYSLAIAFLEFLGDNAVAAPLQIFGTDVSESALEKARSGTYIENIALDVSPERLRRWFVRTDRGYQISKDIREACIFARQNVAADPPFSRIDLISCRNLLIYLDGVLQSRVMPIFHYALKATGFLLLGNSESIGGSFDLFKAIDKRAKVYTKKITGRFSGISFSRRLEEDIPKQSIAMAAAQPVSNLQQAADSFIVSRFAPVGVIIDGEYKIIQFRGSTGDYLEPSPGLASFHLLKMARGHLGAELRSLIQQAKSTGRPVRKEGVSFKTQYQKARELSIEVAPIREDRAADYHFLVLFEERAPAPLSVETSAAPAAPQNTESINGEVVELRKELAAADRQLQSTIEESEATTEELKSANEEIMSSNEELQSTNEELETAKEELQSTNEELTTVNDEVQARNSELNLLNNDLTNFLASVNVPVVMLGTDLRIRRFTPMTQRVFNLIPTDIGRPFGDIKPKVHVPHLEKRIAEVIDTVTTHEQEVVDSDGRFYQLSIRPYRTPEKKIEGAVLVFLDIDSVKQAGLQLAEAKTYAEAIVEAVFDPLLVLDADFVIQRANSAYYQLFQTEARQTENRSLFALDKSQWDIPEIRRLLQATFKHRRKSGPVEITEHFSRIGERSLLINARPLLRTSGKPPLILLTLADITARKRAEREKAKLTLELGKERALFEAVLRQMGMGVAIFEAPGGNLILANEELRTIFRRKLPAAASIASFYKIRSLPITDGGHRGRRWPMDRSLRKGEVVVYEELILPWSKSERVTLQVSSTPVYDAGKQMIAVVALFQDITERKRIKEQIVDISGREQRRIAHDLHDGLGQELAAIAYRLKALKSHLTRAKVDQAEEAGNIGALMEAALSRTRDLVKVIQPVAIDGRGLMQSLKDLAQSSSRLYDIDCIFTCPRPVSIGNVDVALHVFRIAQEAVHNAVKHGKPRQIRIGLLKRRHLAELTIVNDGVDFSPSKGSRNKGLGLHIMSYRANVLHGELTVVRRRPKGTQVKCLFNPTQPYDKK
jgi:two-component system, chemotaxis family, CheB/CheR fusion protein